MASLTAAKAPITSRMAPMANSISIRSGFSGSLVASPVALPRRAAQRLTATRPVAVAATEKPQKLRIKVGECLLKWPNTPSITHHSPLIQSKPAAQVLLGGSAGRQRGEDQGGGLQHRRHHCRPRAPAH